MARILVIDDDESLRRALVRALGSVPHDVLEAGDGRRGMDLARRGFPDLVITDITMPDQEGIQTIRELRDLDPDLPIIVISGEPRVGAYDPLDDSRHLGADAALAKPFQMGDLLAEVDRLLKRDAGDPPPRPGEATP
jgi:DNA-binding response OmpR family regulator